MRKFGNFSLLLIGFLAVTACAVPGEDDLHNQFLHVGKAVSAVETVDVVATLSLYEPDYAHADYENGGSSYDVSIFEIVEPVEYRGKQFPVLHDTTIKRAQIWTKVGRTYSMIIDKDIVEREGAFPGPELVTIVALIQ